MAFFYVSLQFSLPPSPLKANRFLATVSFICYGRIGSLFRRLRPADVYLPIHGISDRLSGPYHQKAPPRYVLLKGS
jgi:hypothetical protein